MGEQVSLTTACTRPRASLDVIVNLAVIQLSARRVMPGVRPQSTRFSHSYDLFAPPSTTLEPLGQPSFGVYEGI